MIEHQNANGPNALSEANAVSMIASFEKKPAKPMSVPGMPKPMSASVPISIIAQVNIMFGRTPPMKRMSCSWCMPWMTEPAPRNSSALKKAWVNRWNIAAP